MSEVVELRCGENPSRMFAKLLVEAKPLIVLGNLIEFRCRDCQKATRRSLVLHRFNLVGELVETVYSEGTTQPAGDEEVTTNDS